MRNSNRFFGLDSTRDLLKLILCQDFWSRYRMVNINTVTKLVWREIDKNVGGSYIFEILKLQRSNLKGSFLLFLTKFNATNLEKRV